MSTKNVALSLEVYQKLARFKRESESFSRAIDRLLDHVGSQHSGADVLQQLASFPPLADEEADGMRRVVDENRAAETWHPRDLS